MQQFVYSNVERVKAVKLNKMYVVVNYKNYQRLIEILFIFSRSFVSRQE
jgi:hypothetical protein